MQHSIIGWSLLLVTPNNRPFTLQLWLQLPVVLGRAFFYSEDAFARIDITNQDLRAFTFDSAVCLGICRHTVVLIHVQCSVQ